jgi:hypothetical protein
LAERNEIAIFDWLEKSGADAESHANSILKCDGGAVSDLVYIRQLASADESLRLVQ